MPRSPRRQQGAAEACCQVLSRGHNRESILADDAERTHLLFKEGKLRAE